MTRRISRFIAAALSVIGAVAVVPDGPPLPKRLISLSVRVNFSATGARLSRNRALRHCQGWSAWRGGKRKVLLSNGECGRRPE
jgi:hypothetical protein